MKIPDWAELALRNHAPRCRSQDRDPDPEATRRWQAYCERFRKRWDELDAGNWKLPPGEAGTKTAYNILTAGLDCAKRIGMNASPLKILKARKDVLKLDQQISILAESLASKIKLRTGMENDAGLASWRRDDSELDPLDLWDALEMSFNPHPLSGYETPRADVWPDMLQALKKARETSLSVPEWPDLLHQLADHFESGTDQGEFPNIAATGYDTNKSKYSPWCTALISILKNWYLLDCLTLEQLASLASLAVDSSDAGEINAKQIGALKRNFLKSNS